MCVSLFPPRFRVYRSQFECCIYVHGVSIHLNQPVASLQPRYRLGISWFLRYVFIAARQQKRMGYDIVGCPSQTLREIKAVKFFYYIYHYTKMPFPSTPSLWTKRQVLLEEPAGEGFGLCLASMRVQYGFHSYFLMTSILLRARGWTSYFHC